MSTLKKSFATLAIYSIGSFAMIIGTSSVYAKDCNWRSLNHDHHNSRSNPCEDVINTTNVVNLVELWSDNSSAPVQSAPVFEDGIVYYGDLYGNVYARNAQDGTILNQIPLGSGIFSSPLITDGALYVATEDLVLFAIDKVTFNILWSVVIDPVAQSTGQGNVYASPVYVDGKVIVGVACDEFTETSTLDVEVRGSLNAFDAIDGSLVWQYVPTQDSEGFGVGFWSTPAIDTKRNLLFVGTSNTVTFPAAKLSDSLLAIHYKTGKLKWFQQFTKADVFGIVNPTGPDKDVGASPNLFSVSAGGHNSGSHKGKKDLVGVCSKAGVYRTFERSSGKLVWERTISETGTRTGNPSAAVHGDTIYAVCTEDLTYAVNGPDIVQFGLHCNEEAFYEYLDGLFEQNTVIKALDACSGHVKWTDVSSSTTFGSVAEANGVLYQVNVDGQIRCLDAKSGTLLNIISANGPFMVAPLMVADGKLFVGEGWEFFSSANGIAVYALPSMVPVPPPL